MKAESVLKNCAEILAERGQQYGPVTQNFGRCSTIASAILIKPITGYDVAIILHALILARMAESRDDLDHAVDGINYLAISVELATEKSATENDF
jgi:hypothetical protein